MALEALEFTFSSVAACFFFYCFAFFMVARRKDKAGEEDREKKFHGTVWLYGGFVKQMKAIRLGFSLKRRTSPHFLSSRLKSPSEWPCNYPQLLSMTPLCLGERPPPLLPGLSSRIASLKKPPGQDLGFNVRTHLALCSQSSRCELTFILIHLPFTWWEEVDGCKMRGS